MKGQVEKAEKFRSLHGMRNPLILPNCWDVASARIFEESGFQAVATSSAGLMVSLGYQDGEEIPLAEMVGAVGRISKVLRVPLSADLVGGFGDSPQAVAKTVTSVLKAGAVGINIEDFVHSSRKLLSLESQESKLRALVKLREAVGIPFVINARTDALRYATGDDAHKMTEAIRRGKAYRDLGADCVYPMGLVDAASISRFVKEVKFPTNVMVRKGLPSVPELRKLGVARVSFGPSASYAALGLLRRASQEVLSKGTYSALTEGAITFDELNALASPGRS